MKFTNKFKFPSPVVKALTADNYSRGESHRSVTQLIDSPRVRVLRAEYPNLMVEDVSERVWSILGTAIHNIFEHCSEGTEHLPEERLFVKIDGWIISGAIDLQTSEANGSITVRDYKSTSVWSVVFGKKEWENQLNAYAWLIRKSKGITATKLEVITIVRDWDRRKGKAAKGNYPPAPIVVVPIKLWSIEEQDKYMQSRIELHSDAEFSRLVGERLPLCTELERWEKKSTYAVKKTKNKRALRVFDSMDEAEAYFAQKDYGEEHSIEFRRGEVVRCREDFCKVAAVCDQYQGEVWSAKGC